MNAVIPRDHVHHDKQRLYTIMVTKKQYDKAFDNMYGLICGNTVKHYSRDKCL